jgi:Domain of unknown function (DUF4167)
MRQTGTRGSGAAQPCAALPALRSQGGNDYCKGRRNLINNRQGGRRRGRGGQSGGRNLGGQPGNRQDNRQRGNAAQLLEKYKSMARDSQLAGDRVQTEYYLQFADHYFRVLSESRARFEDQSPRRQRDDDFDDEDGDEELNEAEAETEASDGDERRDRPDRGPRRQRGDRDQRRFNRDERDSSDGDDRGGARSQLNGGDSLPLDVLPPAIGADDSVSEEAPAPRPRRARRPRPTQGDDEAVPAA